MILDGLKRSHVDDDKLWEMMSRANKLTAGSYASWDDNAPTLVPLMDRIIIRAREKEDWKVYFYVMAQQFWLVRRKAINDIHRAFRISEMFHRDAAQQVGNNPGKFEGEWRVSLAEQILRFYLDYPQADDAKIEQMLEIFLDFNRKYGSQWNYANYGTVMYLALMNRDKKLEEIAKKKISQADYECWCYVCYYGKRMIGYYVLHEDFGGVEEIISNIRERTIPAKYQWCFEECENSGEKELVSIALIDCLAYGKREMFNQVFDKWRKLYQEPEEGKVDDAHKVLFHALVGDWSRGEDRLRLASKDDQDVRKKREAPRVSLYWALCWHCYFRMLDKKGIKTVKLRLGDGAGKGKEKKAGNINQTEAEPETKDSIERPSKQEKKAAGVQVSQEQENLQEWLSLEAAEYFEHQADAIGAQMDRARKRFNYKQVKRTYEECCGIV